jgi:hypothetical protein
MVYMVLDPRASSADVRTLEIRILEDAVQSLRGILDRPADIGVLSHRRLRVPQLIGDLPRRLTVVVQDGRGGLAEAVRGDPGQDIRLVARPAAGAIPRPAYAKWIT